MKKLFLLTKTLLVAVCLLVGASNAWGYVVPSGYEVKNVYVGTDNGDNTVTPENFSSGTYNSSIFGPGTCYHATEAEKLKVVDYTYVALPDVGASVGEAPYPTYVGANGKVLRWHSRSNETQYGTIAMTPVSTGKLVFGVDLNFGGNNTNYAPQIIFVDGEGNNVLQLGFNCGSGTDEYFQYKVGTGSATNDGTVGSSKLRGKYTGHSIRDIVIDMETGDVVYTVDCIGTDGKRQKKTSTKGVNIGTGKTIAGVRLSRNFGAVSQSDYIWADNIELYTVGVESTPHTYTVKAIAGSTELATLQSGSLKEGKNYSVTLNEVIEKDGKFYRLNDNTVTNYTKSYVMGDADENQTINYEEDAEIVFYSELAGATYEEASSTASEGNVRAFNSTSNITTNLNNGVYQILVKVTGSRHSKSGSWRGFSMSLGGVEFANSVGQSAAEHSFSLIVPKNDQTLKFYKGYNESDWIDYIIVKKTADLPSTENIVVTDAGYATYVSNYNLDFTSATTKAYKVSVAEKGVATLTEVAKVPAKTPVLLFVAGGNGEGEAIPVTTDAVDAVTGNNLVAGTGAAVATTDGDYTNMILNVVDEKIGFYFAAGNTVAANRAYLHIATSLAPDAVGGSSPARMAMRFAGDITGVDNVEAAAEAKAKEGKFIENGKLVIVKNGVKYNAAGAKLY